MSTSSIGAIGGLEAAPAPAATASAVRRAVTDTAPFAIGLIPFGLAAGVAASEAGLSIPEAIFGATIMLAGAAQLAAIDVIGRDAGLWSVAMVVALVNLRFVFYGAGVARWFSGLPLRRRLALAFPVVDQTFLLCHQRFDEEVALGWRQRYYLTVTALLAGTFVGSQVVSLLLGAGLPADVGLHLAAPLAFTGLLAKSISGRQTAVAAVAAAVALVASSGAAGSLTLPLMVAIGVTVARVVGGSR